MDILLTNSELIAWQKGGYDNEERGDGGGREKLTLQVELVFTVRTSLRTFEDVLSVPLL